MLKALIVAIVTVIATTLTSEVLIPYIVNIYRAPPTVNGVRPSPLVAGEEFDITGKNLEQVAEVVLTRGTRYRIRLGPIIFENGASLSVWLPSKVEPLDYNLLFRTTKKEDVATGETVNVVSP